jgi:hypothetical protein
VRIATPNIAAAATKPFDSFDLVSPSRLFELAATRFDAALATSTIGGPDTSPSAMVAVMAMQQVQSGLNSLQSINVPTTPWDVRTRAARAIDQAHQAVDLLRQYHAEVVGLGDHAHGNDTLPPLTLGLLESGRLHLRLAISIARHS